MKKHLYYSCLVALLLFSHSAISQGVYSFEGGTSGFLGKELKIFQDTSGQKTYLDIYNSDDLQKGEQSVLNFNYSESPYWMRLDFANNSDEDEVIFDLSFPPLDTVQIYVIKNGQLEQQLLYGDNYDITVRPLRHQNYFVSIDMEKGEEATVIFKITSNGPLLAPVRLSERVSFIEALLLSDVFKGIYFGIMFVMFFYNLLIYFITRDKNYIYYITYILFIYLTQASLDGFTYRYAFHSNPRLYDFLLIFFASMAGVSGLEFMKKFLHLKEKARKLLIGFIITQVVYALAIVANAAGLIGVSFRIVDLAATFISLFAIITAIYLATKGYRPAKFFLVAWSFLLVGIVIFVLRNLGVVPFNSFTENILHVGTSLEVILLSIALADKINVLRREKEESQAEALRVSRENEKIIREQNVVLEQKVQERTTELQEANEELQVTLSNLKETQTQLVDAEKMASLGQLTAGIAHEINNPINFVTSNITPLKRDLEEVYEIVDAYAAVNEENSKEGLDKARELMEDLDYEYLKEEIDSLVGGISDGALRTKEIVQGLRTFSRLDEDAIKQADLHENLDSTMVLLNNKTKGQVEIMREYDEQISSIDCYPGKLNQVFMNILNNGIYAVNHKTYEEGEKPCLSVKTELKDDIVEITLSDNGVGMDETTKKKLFEPFFTTKEVGEGTGLGMSIVFKIIEKHNGTISVKSELGKGSDFIITLPLRQPNEFE